MTKEALKLALEAFDSMIGRKPERVEQAITAIKEALANEALEKMAENARELGLDYEPAQEPVAWRAWVSKFPQGTGSDWVYVTKPIMKDSIHNQPLYTTPPQRTWVGLTDGEVDKMILLMGFPPDWITENAIVKNIVRNLEAKLKEKNS